MAEQASALPTLPLRISDLARRSDRSFEITPNATERALIATELGIRGIKKLRFSGQIAPVGKSDWRLDADLGATVVQECVVTLGPVTTRIDEAVTRIYVTEMPEILPGEVEMPEDDSVDPLPEVLDVAQVMIEALSLALPPFPRVPGATLEADQFAQAAKAAMSDDEARPFAGLAALRETLEKNDSDPED